MEYDNAKNHSTIRRDRNPRPIGHNFGQRDSSPSWATATPEDLCNYIGRITDAGACLILSKSSDGGVLSITVLYAGERWRSFPRSGEEACADLHNILGDIGG